MVTRKWLRTTKLVTQCEQLKTAYDRFGYRGVLVHDFEQAPTTQLSHGTETNDNL